MKRKTRALTQSGALVYLIGTIWAMEIDIFRSRKLVDPQEFHTVQSVHSQKLPYWIFAPLGIALVGSFALIWHHPRHISRVGHLGKSGVSARVSSTYRNLVGQMASKIEQR
jgi:hypothetical protein